MQAPHGGLHIYKVLTKEESMVARHRLRIRVTDEPDDNQMMKRWFLHERSRCVNGCSQDCLAANSGSRCWYQGDKFLPLRSSNLKTISWPSLTRSA